jgi:acid phosphatase family membrane protein YuiD
MPSLHATLVCALATTVAIVYGVNSAVFAIAAFFALVVMYDAVGVRQTVSTQSTILNRILEAFQRASRFSATSARAHRPY